MRSSRRSSLDLRRAPAILLALVTLLAAAGCSATATSPPGSLSVSGAWVRPPATPGLPAAGYLTIRNQGAAAEVLLGVTSPVAGSVEIHRTTTSSGMTGMQPVDSIHIPAGGTVTLEPGGFHLMLQDVQELTVGETVDLVLTFERAGAITVKAEVRNG